jgi:hypothetical protein
MLAAAGDEEGADTAIRRAAALGRGYGHFHHTAYYIASAHALLGRPDSAVAWLRVTIDDGFPCYPCFNDDPNFSRIRFDSRFASMMSSLKEQWNRFASRYAM